MRWALVWLHRDLKLRAHWPEILAVTTCFGTLKDQARVRTMARLARPQVMKVILTGLKRKREEPHNG